MKLPVLAALFILPSLGFAKENPVAAEHAASLVRQSGVEKCLSAVESYKGSAYFQKITKLKTIHGKDSSTTTYKLEGSNLTGDIMAGNWEILVTETSQELGLGYDCKVIKNEE